MEEKIQTASTEDTDTALWVLSQLKSAQSMLRSQCFEKAVALTSEAISLCSSSSSSTLFLPTTSSSSALLSACWATIAPEFLPCEPDLASLNHPAVLFVGHNLRGQALLHLGDQADDALEDFSRASQLRPADTATLRYLRIAEAAVRDKRDRAALDRHLRSCCGRIGQGGAPCPREALLECDGCREIGLSHRVRARYCGEECRAAAFSSHALFHRMLRRPRRSGSGSGSGLAETCCLAMLELAAVDERPAPVQEGTLTLLVLSAEEGQEEGQEEEEDWMGEFLQLGELLRRFVYPDRRRLRRLQVLLAGGTGRGRQEEAAACCPDPTDPLTVTVRCIPAAGEQVLSATLTCQVCFLLCPGFLSLFFPSSSDGKAEGGPRLGLGSVVEALLGATEPVPVVVTSRALEADRDRGRDGHALFNEDCLRDFWGAHILTPTTCNPRCDPRPRPRPECDPLQPDSPLSAGRRNRFYTIAKGRRRHRPPVALAAAPCLLGEADGDSETETDLKRRLAIGYLQMRAGRAASSRLRCGLLRLAQDLLSGAEPFTGQSLRQLMDAAALRSDLT